MEKERLAELIRLAGPIVRLNVGGENVDIPRETLCSVHNSLLAQYFSGKHDDTLVKIDNRVFVDRDPLAFRNMIALIRTHGDYNKIQSLDAF